MQKSEILERDQGQKNIWSSKLNFSTYYCFSWFFRTWDSNFSSKVGPKTFLGQLGLNTIEKKLLFQILGWVVYSFNGGDFFVAHVLLRSNTGLNSTENRQKFVRQKLISLIRHGKFETSTVSMAPNSNLNAKFKWKASELRWLRSFLDFCQEASFFRLQISGKNLMFRNQAPFFVTAQLNHV